MLSIAFAMLALAAPPVAPAPETPPQARRVELSRAFRTRTPWALDVTEGPPGEDNGGNPAPGVLRLCLRKAGGPCQDETLAPPPYDKTTVGSDYPPHYLRQAGPVYPQGAGGAPLLRVVTASQSAGDGGQVIAFQLLSYSRAQDRFVRVYSHLTGSNNNEETRFVDAGPLRGDVISADPTTTRRSATGSW